MKRALVTGASRGIGASCAKRLASTGFEIGVNYKNSEAAAIALAREISGAPLYGDVSNAAEVQRMFEDFGNVDALVCNAGVALTGLFQDTANRWREVFDTNFGGAVNCINAAVPHMIREKYGRIVIVSSVWGQTGASCESIYSASKAALIGLTKSLAKELGPSCITVNCVAPGVIDTDMNATYSKADIAELCAATPLGRLGTAAEVAAAVAWLCSEESSFVTGQVIGVDGGFGG